MCGALQAEVDSAEVCTVNENSGLVKVFERIIDTSEEYCILIAEAVWMEGEAARAQGNMVAAVAFFEKAMYARGASLCADSMARRDRVIEMRQQVLLVRRGGDDGGEAETEQAAWDKCRLASDLHDREDYDAAATLFQEAIKIFTAISGSDSLVVASSYEGIGLVFDTQCKYEKALESFQKSLALKIRLVGLGHLSVANSYDHIGGVDNLQGKYVEALEYYQKSLEIKIREVGHDHLSVAMSYIWYRKCLLCTGQVHGGARRKISRS